MDGIGYGFAGDDYYGELTHCVLQSMRHGSNAGQALFPLVILAVKDNSRAALNMAKLRQSVPLNMFLPWVTQLISHLQDSSTIEQLLLDITEEYPTHVQLPFTITKKLLSQDRLQSKYGHFFIISFDTFWSHWIDVLFLCFFLKFYLDAIDRLESKLPIDPTWNFFLESIDYLFPPERAARDLLDAIYKGMMLKVSNFSSQQTNLLRTKFLRKGFTYMLNVCD